LEYLNTGEFLYNGNWTEFKTEFKKHFETHNKACNVQEELKAMKQGLKQLVADFIAKFKEYAGRTCWSAVDLHTRLQGGLNSAPKDALALINRKTNTFDLLKKQAAELDVWLEECQAEKACKGGKPNPHSLSSGHLMHRTKDTDAMDIDTAKTGKPNIGNWMIKWKGHCRKCGFNLHKSGDVNHSRKLCKYCNTAGHTDFVCVSKFLGQDPKKKKKKGGQTVNTATTDSTSAATLHLVSLAALETLQKQVVKLQSQKQELESAFAALPEAF
jgi:hypothetical protein